MIGMFMCIFPLTIYFLPDDYFSIIGTRSKDVSIHWVSPCYLPYWTFMSTNSQRFFLQAISGKCNYMQSGMQQRFPLIIKRIRKQTYSCRLAINVWAFPLTSNILTERSDEQVASLVP